MEKYCWVLDPVKPAIAKAANTSAQVPRLKSVSVCVYEVWATVETGTPRVITPEAMPASEDSLQTKLADVNVNSRRQMMPSLNI